MNLLGESELPGEGSNAVTEKLRIRCPLPSPMPVRPIPGQLPVLGEILEDCEIVGVLGQGASGQVFLARQLTLNYRPLVLKLTSLGHNEHLNLARLQHTNIMPLYWTSITPERSWRVLAMPYLGRTTLSRLIRRLQTTPISSCTGLQVREALRVENLELPIHLPVQDKVADSLARIPWNDLVIQFGRSLAEALAYAHHRQLLHLDIKPSNILVTPEGTPMLLDLDVAQGPIATSPSREQRLGGTRRYASPEQQAAMEAIHENRAIPHAIDGRSDQYSLAVVLYECLGGPLTDEGPNLRMLRQKNPTLEAGVMDILTRCLASRAEDRYPDCESLADDLHRQLQHRPLRGVRNRLGERCRKWYRSHPYQAAFALALIGFAGTAGAAGHYYQQQQDYRRQQVEKALFEGQEWYRQGEFEVASRHFQEAIDLTEGLSGTTALRDQLHERMATTHRRQRARELKEFVHTMRFHTLQSPATLRLQHVLEGMGRRFWSDRQTLLDASKAPLELAVEREIQAQFKEMMSLWIDLQIDLAPESHRPAVRREIETALRDSEGLLGVSFIALAKRQLDEPLAGEPHPAPKAAWEYLARGRIASREGRFDDMARDWQSALQCDPTGYASNYYAGLAAMHLHRYDVAIRNFSFCLGKEPRAECYCLRGQALSGISRWEEAIEDYSRAIAANPQFMEAYSQRGSALKQLGRREEADKDYENARKLAGQD